MPGLPTTPFSSPSRPREGLQELIGIGFETARLLDEAGSTQEVGKPPYPILEQLIQQLEKLLQWKELHTMAVQNRPAPAETPPDMTRSRDMSGASTDSLRALPRRVSASDTGLYDALHDTRLKSTYWTVELALLMTILAKPAASYPAE